MFGRVRVFVGLSSCVLLTLGARHETLASVLGGARSAQLARVPRSAWLHIDNVINMSAGPFRMTMNELGCGTHTPALLHSKEPGEPTLIVRYKGDTKLVCASGGNHTAWKYSVIFKAASGKAMEVTLSRPTKDAPQGCTETATINYIVAREGYTGAVLVQLADAVNQCFGARTARLSDAARLMCKTQKLKFDDGECNYVPLSMFRTITRGETWYQKLGFTFAMKEGSAVTDQFVEERRVAREAQRALHALTFDELRHVSRACGSEDHADWLAGLFSKFEDAGHDSVATSGKTAGSFFEWLFAHDCHKVRFALTRALIFPCRSYTSEILRSLRKVPFQAPHGFDGDMTKSYPIDAGEKAS